MTPEEKIKFIEEKKIEIARLYVQSNAIKENLAAEIKSLAIVLCPFSIGDKVDYRDQCYIVAAIKGGMYGHRYAMQFYKIKKDGTPAKRTCSFYGEPSAVKLCK